MDNEITNWSSKKYFTLLFLAYTLAHGGILSIPNAIYWDDWTLYLAKSQDIIETFQEVGSMFNLAARLHIALLSIGPWLYKILTFILMFGSAAALDSVLRKYDKLNASTRFIIILFFLVLPFNWARVALIDMPYTICYFFFFLAWSLIDRYRILSLILFFLSFNTNSLLVFYLLPCIDNYFRYHNEKFNIKKLLSFSIARLDFLLLPFLFFFIKIFLFSPSGLYAGYNEQYSIRKLIFMPIPTILNWISELKLSVGIFFIAVTILYYLLRSHITLISLRFNYSKKHILIIGLFVFLLGGIPYWILGYIPTFSEWTTRHQLLFPLGGAILLTLLVELAESNVRVLLLSVILAIFIPANISTYKDLYFDWQKQKQLISLFKNNDTIRESQLIAFIDNTIDENALKRTYRSYEWNGLLTLAFGNQKRLGIGINEFESMQKGEKLYKGYITNGQRYLCGDLEFKSPLRASIVTINYEPISLMRQVITVGNPPISLITTEINPILIEK